MDYRLIATTTFGLEAVTKKELQRLGYDELVVENGKIELDGDAYDIAMLNTWLRTAERVLIKVAEFPATSFEELFEGTTAIDWSQFVPEDGKMHVVGKSVKSKLFSVPDCQSIVKKAIVKSMGRAYDREFFDEDGAVYKIEVALLKDVVTLSIDTSGAGLHKRGYRADAGGAPLKETLAAALVQMARWNFSTPLVDPFCGSGTLLIEGSMYARNMAPGLNRNFVCETWPNFEASVFDDVREDARGAVKDKELTLYGYDIDGKVLKIARANALAAGVGSNIEFQRRDFYDFSSGWEEACLIANPPYGERLLDEKEVARLNKEFGVLASNFPRWHLNIFSAAGGFEEDFGRKSDKNRKLYNGRILTRFYQYYAK